MSNGGGGGKEYVSAKGKDHVFSIRQGWCVRVCVCVGGGGFSYSFLCMIVVSVLDEITNSFAIVLLNLVRLSSASYLLFF